MLIVSKNAMVNCALVEEEGKGRREEEEMEE
jgi:hypothetical protein